MPTKPRVVLTRPSRGKRTSYVREDGAADSETAKTKLVPKNPLPSTPSIEGGRKVGNLGNEKENESVARVYDLAMQLTITDRRELLARLSLAAQAPSKDSRDLDMWCGSLHSAFVASLGTSQASSIGLLPMKRMASASSNWTPVEEFMERAGYRELSVVERQSMYMLLAQLLVDHARELAHRGNIPLSGKFVVNCAQHVASIFDAAFPGYLRAGMAPLVATQLTRARD